MKPTWFPNLSQERFPVQTLSGTGLSGFQKGKDLPYTLSGTQTGEAYTQETDVVLEDIVIHPKTNKPRRRITHKLLSIPQNTREGDKKHWLVTKPQQLLPQNYNPTDRNLLEGKVALIELGG